MQLSSLKYLALATIASALAFSSPSLAFNPQPDPPGKVRTQTTPTDKKTVKGPAHQAKPDCTSRSPRNPCL